MRRPGGRPRERQGILPSESTDARAEFAGEAGGAGLLGVGLGVCAGMLLVGGIAVTSAQLARIDVLDAADHASASAADRLSVRHLYEHGVDAPQLDPAQVDAEARRVLAGTPRPARVVAWHVVSTRVDTDEVVVTVSATVKPAVIGTAMQSLGAPVVVTLTSRAEAHPAS